MTSEAANRGGPIGVPHEDEVVVGALPYSGVNNRDDPRNIAETQAAELLNVDLENPSRPKRRDGYDEVGSGRPTSDAVRASLLADLDAGDASRLLVVAYPGSGIYATRDPGGAPWFQVSTFDVTTGQAKGVQGNDLLWVLTPGTGNPIQAIDTAGAIYDLGIANESPPQDAADGVYMLSRLWLISGNRLYWSKLLPTLEDMTPTPNAFDRTNTADTGGGFIELSPEQSGDAVAVVAWREESLIIFFRNQIEEVIINSASPILSTRRRIEGKFGTVARDSVVQIGDDVYFLDQYGSYRSLRRNQQGIVSGVVPEPISDTYRAELPNNLNKRTMYKTQAELLGEFLYVMYPSASAEDPDRGVVFDLGRQTVYGPWEFAHPVGRLLASDIESREPRLYSTNGNSTSPTSKVYRWFNGNYLDDGTAITYRERGRAWTGGFPHLYKRAEWYDLEFTGDFGAAPSVGVRMNESDDFVTLADGTIEAKVTPHFPIAINASFPLDIDDSFPILFGEVKTTTIRGQVDETYAGDLPLHDQNLPITEADLPINGAGGVGQGRLLQWEITEDTPGVAFERVGVYFGMKVRNIELDETY